MNEEVSKYLAKIGREGGKIGGQSTSKEKLRAIGKNLQLAHKARRKYKPCNKYANKSHRFSPITNKCYGCGYPKPTK